MRDFINVVEDDFYTALKNGRIINSHLKPKPYKNYRELDGDEKIIIGCIGQLHILYHGDKDIEHKVQQSIDNHICRMLPELAEKHNIIFDESIEYWRKK